MFSFLQSLSAVAFSDFYVQAGPPDYFGGENVFEFWLTLWSLLFGILQMFKD
jgi:hypothetical protein